VPAAVARASAAARAQLGGLKVGGTKNAKLAQQRVKVDRGASR
jgi:hypothetical protein